jgi:alkylated DNA repair dioxygenase AlkB
MKNLKNIIEPPISFYPAFLTPKEINDCFEKSQKLEWERGEINMYGKKIPVPREESLFGDDFNYSYRGVKIKAEPWPDFLLELRNRIQAISGFDFNFVVGNRYLNGRDSIGWHSDDFPQIGKQPPIASLSLGSTRRFKLKHKETGQINDYDLENGSLLIMLPGCQDDWLHAVPKTAKEVGERINWTFRPHIDAVL